MKSNDLEHYLEKPISRREFLKNVMKGATFLTTFSIFNLWNHFLSAKPSSRYTLYIGSYDIHYKADSKGKHEILSSTFVLGDTCSYTNCDSITKELVPKLENILPSVNYNLDSELFSNANYIFSYDSKLSMLEIPFHLFFLDNSMIQKIKEQCIESDFRCYQSLLEKYPTCCYKIHYYVTVDYKTKTIHNSYLTYYFYTFLDYYDQENPLKIVFKDHEKDSLQRIDRIYDKITFPDYFQKPDVPKTVPSLEDPYCFGKHQNSYVYISSDNCLVVHIHREDLSLIEYLFAISSTFLQILTLFFTKNFALAQRVFTIVTSIYKLVLSTYQQLYPELNGDLEFKIDLSFWRSNCTKNSFVSYTVKTQYKVIYEDTYYHNFDLEINPRKMMWC